jgi:hypothetical protein
MQARGCCRRGGGCLRLAGHAALQAPGRANGASRLHGVGVPLTAMLEGRAKFGVVIQCSE